MKSIGDTTKVEDSLELSTFVYKFINYPTIIKASKSRSINTNIGIKFSASRLFILFIVFFMGSHNYYTITTRKFVFALSSFHYRTKPYHYQYHQRYHQQNIFESRVVSSVEKLKRKSAWLSEDTTSTKHHFIRNWSLNIAHTNFNHNICHPVTIGARNLHFNINRRMTLTSLSSSKSTSEFKTNPENMNLLTHLNQSKDFIESILKEHDNVRIKNKVYITIGNEAGDADSIVSALAQSYVMQMVLNDNNYYIPIVSIPSSDMSLRRDATLLLERCGIDILSDLLYLDDKSVQRILLKNDDNNDDKNLLNIVLMDHNVIRKDLNHLSNQVTLILDHHEDEHKHLHVTTDSQKFCYSRSTNEESHRLFSNRDIAFANGKATVGSTCTLVTERLIHYYNDDLNENTKTQLLDPNLALMLLGTILLDTVNMSPSAGKGTERDERAIQFLLKNTDWCNLLSNAPELFNSSSSSSSLSLKPDETLMFNWLSNAKFDPKFWHQMSPMDCLRIDYKHYYKSSTSSSKINNPSLDLDSSVLSSFGLSSILLPLSDFWQKKDTMQSLQIFMKGKQINLLGVMSCTFEKSDSDATAIPKRSMLLVGTNEHVMSTIVEYLLHSPETSFLEFVIDTDSSHLDSYDDSSGMIIKSFQQGNSKGSRKQVAPVMLDFMNNRYSKL